MLDLSFHICVKVCSHLEWVCLFLLGDVFTPTCKASKRFIPSSQTACFDSLDKQFLKQFLMFCKPLTAKSLTALITFVIILLFVSSFQSEINKVQIVCIWSLFLLLFNVRKDKRIIRNINPWLSRPFDFSLPKSIFSVERKLHF